MSELKISPNFTIDDIHKVREYNYERRRNMTFEEYQSDVQDGAGQVMARIEQARRKMEFRKQNIS